MPSRCTRVAAAASLLALSLSATAASVVVEAFLITQSGAQPSADSVLNAPGCTPGSTSSTECVRITDTIGLLRWGTGGPVHDPQVHGDAA